MRFAHPMSILLVAVLLSPLGVQAAHQSDHDERETHGMTGSFEEGASSSDLEDFHSTVELYGSESTIEGQSFTTESPSIQACEALREDLVEKSYIAALSDCNDPTDSNEEEGETTEGNQKEGESVEESENENADNDNETHDNRPDNTRNTPQGRALGHDGEWHACRDAAGDNETAKRECHDAAMERARERHEAIKAARAQHRIGGELNISRGQHRIDNATGVTFDVETADETGDHNAPEVRVEVGADLDRGQTIVLDVDPALFDDLDNIVVAYYDIMEDGTETPVDITEADSLEDVLDPDDDDGPEYWAVEDPEGLHVLVSIPSWSVHAITLDSNIAGTGGDEDGVGIPGVGAVSLTTLVLSLAMTLRRRV